jgi:hypothetical protein
MSTGASFVCIVGAPRSGTTWLQAMLGEHPRVATLHELKLFDLFTGRWQQSWQQLADLERVEGGGRRGLRRLWSDDEFEAFLTKIVADVHESVRATKPGASVVVDKSPGYSHYVEQIGELVPGVKFIHLLRDGRDVAVSLRAASRGWARTWAPGSIESAASLWRSMAGAAMEAREVAPERYLEIRYEQMQADGAAALMKVFAFVGVEASPDEATAIWQRHTLDRMQRDPAFDLPRDFFRRGHIGSWCDEMSALERYCFDAVAGEMLCALGYAERGWWVERAHQRWLMPVLAALPMRRGLRVLSRRLGSVPAAGVE